MGCDRATWARMQDKGPWVPFGADRLRTFTFGFCAEDFVIDAIRQHTPIEEGVQVTLEGFLVGHPDGVTEDEIIEVKTTEFLMDRQTWTRIVPRHPDDLSLHYRVQAAAYAIALGKHTCIVVAICRASGQMAVVEFNPEDYRVAVMQRVNRLRRLKMQMDINPDAMPEPHLELSTINKRGESWLCKHCAFTGCPKNRNPLKEGIHA